MVVNDEDDDGISLFTLQGILAFEAAQEKRI